VLDASANRVKAFVKGEGLVELEGSALGLAQKALSTKTDNPITRGSLIRVSKDAEKHWQIVQIPRAEAALVSLVPGDGAIRALVGGFDFSRNKFNHVIQAWRQPGSSFKPFIYSAALEKGFTPATVINDAPIVLDAAAAGGKTWEPKNFDGTYGGPTRMRVGLMKSKNLVSIRILRAIGTGYAQDYITRFGFSPEQHPPYLTMALGAGSATPFQMVSAYSVLANGGYRVRPYYVERVLDSRGAVLAQANPVRAGQNAEQVIDPRNAFIMTSMLQDVVRHGTAARAMQLGRTDLAGKTGTTNDQVDAWFCGYNSGLVAVAWIGFDQPHTLGGSETGAQAALPIWMAYMGKALKGVPETQPSVPDGVAVDRISPVTGLRVTGQDGIPEYFYKENQPREQSGWDEALPEDGGTAEDVKNQIF
jgi:penicillin-binding protein 1A